jgi:hypothetical protein
MLILQCHQVDLAAQQVEVLLLHLLIGGQLVVLLAVIIHKFLAQATKELLLQLTLQNKRVQVVAEEFKQDNNLMASALLCYRTAPLQ